MSVKFSEALRVPLVDGVKVTLTVQAPLAGSVAAVQESALTAKSAESGPAIVTEKTLRSLMPPFETVTVCDALVVLSVCAANVRLEGEKAGQGPADLVEIFATNRFVSPSNFA